MLENTMCQLCQQNKELRKSHIIPKFVGEWIKETSVTGKMRAANNPNLRIQDSNRGELLCGECEQLFSVYEKYFSETFFRPFLNTRSPIIQYDEKLRKFVVSFLWRVLVASDAKWKNKKHELAAQHTKQIWRDYLYNNVNLDSPQYLLMLKLVPDAKMVEGPLALDLNWYFFSTADITIAQNDEDALVYAKIPGFSFFASIYRHHLSFFQNCQIMNQGTFDFNAQNVDSDIFRFLLNRANLMFSQIQSLSDSQLSKIESDYEKFADKIPTSYGFKIYLAKQFRNKKKT